jgi:hypothetical protein
VRSLSGLHNAICAYAKGKEAFASAGCSACHGPDGKGMHALGAPNLTDKVWLYGSSEATIIETITKGASEPDAGLERVPRRRKGARAFCLCAEPLSRQTKRSKLSHARVRAE